jgi:hypothetical protein
LPVFTSRPRILQTTSRAAGTILIEIINRDSGPKTYDLELADEPSSRLPVTSTTPIKVHNTQVKITKNSGEGTVTIDDLSYDFKYLPDGKIEVETGPFKGIWDGIFEERTFLRHFFNSDSKKRIKTLGIYPRSNNREVISFTQNTNIVDGKGLGIRGDNPDFFLDIDAHGVPYRKGESDEIVTPPLPHKILSLVRKGETKRTHNK